MRHMERNSPAHGLAGLLGGGGRASLLSSGGGGGLVSRRLCSRPWAALRGHHVGPSQAMTYLIISGKLRAHQAPPQAPSSSWFQSRSLCVSVFLSIHLSGFPPINSSSSLFVLRLSVPPPPSIVQPPPIPPPALDGLSGAPGGSAPTGPGVLPCAPAPPGVPHRGHDHRHAHPHPGPGHQERPRRPARGAAQGAHVMAPRHEGPDPQVSAAGRGLAGMGPGGGRQEDPPCRAALVPAALGAESGAWAPGGYELLQPEPEGAGRAASGAPLSVAALASPQPQLRLLLPGHVGRVLRHRGPGHVDPVVPAPRSGRAEDSGDVQQPAVWGQGQVGPGWGPGRRGVPCKSAGPSAQPDPAPSRAPLPSVPTASSSGPSPALLAFWVWPRGQEPRAGAACGPSGPTRWCVLWACWALPSSSASFSWLPRVASWVPM